MRHFELLVIGEINPDLVVRGGAAMPTFGQSETLVEAADLTIGSSAAIMACGAARLGLRTAFAGVVGDDLFGRYMLDAMAQRGVDVEACRRDPGLRTGVSVILSRPDDRAILTFPGAIPALRAADVPERLLRDSAHVHLASYFLLDALRPDAAGLLARARAFGATTSLDPNYDPRELWDGGLDEVLAQLDVLLPNETEALRIAGADTVEAALAALARRVPTVALKLGAEGAAAHTAAGTVRRPVLPVPVADTTGAGDSFDAGFLYGWLRGWPPEACLSLGVACGSLSTRRSGGTEAQPTLDEALQALPESWRPSPPDRS